MSVARRSMGMDTGIGIGRVRTRYFTRPGAAAAYLDDHLTRHYAGTFLGVACPYPEGRLVLLVRDPDDPDNRADARRWLECFGPEFCGLPLTLDPDPGARP